MLYKRKKKKNKNKNKRRFINTLYSIITTAKMEKLLVLEIAMRP